METFLIKFLKDLGVKCDIKTLEEMNYGGISSSHIGYITTFNPDSLSATISHIREVKMEGSTFKTLSILRNKLTYTPYDIFALNLYCRIAEVECDSILSTTNSLSEKAYTKIMKIII